MYQTRFEDVLNPNLINNISDKTWNKLEIEIEIKFLIN